MLGLMRSNQMRAEFEGQVAPWLDALYAGALRLTRNERDAEDLVQDTVMRAYRFYDRFEKGTNFRAWLFKILTNTFINGYRRNQKARTLDTESERQSVEAHFFSAEATAQAQNPEEYLLDRALSEDVLQAIDTLPIDFRMVVILADLQEFSYKDIAEVLSLPVGTVMSRLFRGRRQLARVLKDSSARDEFAQPIDLQTWRARKKVP